MIGEKQLLTALMRPVMGQFAHPHGPLGWLAALAIPMGHRQYYAKTATALRLQPDDVLLDVACGSGDFLAEQAANVAHVTGVDLSGIEVRLARRRLHDRIAAGTARIIQGDAANLPLRDSQFTAVNCVGAFLAFDEPGRPLAEMHRVLAPGGRAVVCLETHAQDGRVRAPDHDVLGIPLYTERQVRDLFTEAGFGQVDIVHDGQVMVATGTRSQAARPQS
jgi:ubiquinone/menaquinone biosynthesis C-methylase UbiE